MNILVLACLTEATGNAVTACRIARHLSTDHRVLLADTCGLDGPSTRELAASERIDFVVAIHALLAGPFARASELPYALCFGGTDLYEDTHPLHAAQMRRAVEGAATLVAFSDCNRAQAEALWPATRGRIEVIAQGVDTRERGEPGSIRETLGLSTRDRIVFLPTGIRRVKDPVHVLGAFAEWHAHDPSVHLVVAGAALEAGYADGAIAAIRATPGAHYVGALSRPALLAAMGESDVVLNSSLSEGMCGTILEAMSVGVPVVARRNDGNDSLVHHGESGCVYETPEEFVRFARDLLRSDLLRHRVTRGARRVIERRACPKRERDAWLGMLGGRAERKLSRPA